MNISPISMTSFGKKPIFTCVVKTIPEKKKKFATLYEMDSKNPDDRDEFINDSELWHMRNAFLTLKRDVNSKFYVLRDEETNETVSSAQTSRHYNQDMNSPYEGHYTLIEELNGNRRYSNSTEPIIGQIAKDAYDGYDENILTAFDTSNKRYLERYKFVSSENGAWLLPKKRFIEVRDKTEERGQKVYLA